MPPTIVDSLVENLNEKYMQKGYFCSEENGDILIGVTAQFISRTDEYIRLLSGNMHYALRGEWIKTGKDLAYTIKTGKIILPAMSNGIIKIPLNNGNLFLFRSKEDLLLHLKEKKVSLELPF